MQIKFTFTDRKSAKVRDSLMLSWWRVKLTAHSRQSRTYPPGRKWASMQSKVPSCKTSSWFTVCFKLGTQSLHLSENRSSTCNSSGDKYQRLRGAQRWHCSHSMPLKNCTKIKLNKRTNKKNNRKSRVIVSAVLKSFLLVSLIAASYSKTNFVRIFRLSLQNKSELTCCSVRWRWKRPKNWW